MAKYDIFISYRREGGYDTAKHLYDLLTRDGYNVSFDIDTLRSGNFDTQLLERIDQCKDFILLIDPHCFDRTLDPNFNPKHDWLRQELAYALRKKKNIIPIFLNGVKGFPQNLPADIRDVTRCNGPEYNRYYFNDFYKTLKEKFITTRKRNIKPVLLTLAVICVLAIVITLLFRLGTSGSSNASMSDSIDIEERIRNVISEDPNLMYERKLKNFCGSFSEVTPGAMEGGINHVYLMELDPLNSKVEYIDKDLDIDIRDSKGWAGTEMQWPEIWEVWQFDMNEDGKSATVEFRKRMTSFDEYRETIICTVKLELDENKNLKMSYVSGDSALGPLYDSNGGFSEVAIFRRDK